MVGFAPPPASAASGTPQGKTAEARNLPAPVYNWFTEGFDTPEGREGVVGGVGLAITKSRLGERSTTPRRTARRGNSMPKSLSGGRRKRRELLFSGEASRDRRHPRFIFSSPSLKLRVQYQKDAATADLHRVHFRSRASYY